jgi:DNA primase
VRLTNVERNIWKDVPKAKLIQYYNSMADYILPYIKDRPLSLHVKPNGANAPGLYIKDMEGRQPNALIFLQTNAGIRKPASETRSIILSAITKRRCFI